MTGNKLIWPLKFCRRPKMIAFGDICYRVTRLSLPKQNKVAMVAIGNSSTETSEKVRIKNGNSFKTWISLLSSIINTFADHLCDAIQ